jgi:Helix-turn-helix
LAPFARGLHNLLINLNITNVEVAARTGIHERTVGNWRNGVSLPRPEYFNLLIRYLKTVTSAEALNALTLVYDQARRGEVSAEQKIMEAISGDEQPEIIEEKAIEQIPAAFRFGIQDNKIDALPENLETLDPAISQDLYEELVAKARAISDRLKRSNADPHAGFAVVRLLQSLGAHYEDVRPGVVLSRLRSIESIVAGFDSEEGRAALFPDAVAMLSDVYLSGQDFLATFPNVRRIERERIAAGLEKDPAVIDKAMEETEAIHTAAAGSEIVAPGAVNALGENDPDIREAQSVELKAT